jgi:hypothetical protein
LRTFAPDISLLSTTAKNRKAKLKDFDDTSGTELAGDFIARDYVLTG